EIMYDSPQYTTFNTSNFITIPQSSGTISITLSIYDMTPGIGYTTMVASINPFSINIKRIPDGEDSPLNYNSHDVKIIPQQHFPAVSVSDFLIALKQNFGLAYYFDHEQQQVEFSFAKDILQTESLDLTKNVIVGQDIEIGEPKYYILSYQKEDSDLTNLIINGSVAVYADLFVPKKEGLLYQIRDTNKLYISKKKLVYDPVTTKDIPTFFWEEYADSWFPLHLFKSFRFKPTEIQISSGPIPMKLVSGVVYPHLKEQGISSAFQSSGSELSDIIFAFFSNGLQASSTGFFSPNGLSLDLLSDRGPYYSFMKPWYEFLSNANEYTFDFLVTLEDMLRILILFQPQPVQFGTSQIRRVRIGNQLYIPKQFTFELTHNDIKCQAKLIKNDGKY
ncbi:MAG: hypothetical protein RSA53_11260, partial [Odoribacter sp.]